jgi:hypothetical protein
MAVYKNSKGYADTRSVEFTETPNGKLQAFFYLRSAQDIETFKKHLAEAGLRYVIEAQTNVAGTPVLVTQFESSQQDVLQWLARQGNEMVLSHHQKSLDPWIIRSFLGFGGQTLQLASAFMRPRGGVDIPILLFAATNMTANVINFMYKAQDKDDPNQLRFLKDRYNQSLSPHLKEDQAAPVVDDKRKTLRPDYKDSNRVQSLDSFMRANSVNVGELGLRYLGAFGMVSPMTIKKDGVVVKHNWWESIKKFRLPELEHANPFRLTAGAASIFGKTLALGSKIPDPYDTKPCSWFDNIREKYTFVTGGLIEAGAFSVLAYDCLVRTAKDDKTMQTRGIDWSKLKIPGVKGVTRDWLGGIGAAMFVTGYIVRSWAKYGERHVDMEELYAHVSDTLAKLPPEKLPQLLADTAADIKTHFKDDPKLDFGTIYTELTNDLKRYHHIDVAPLSTKPAPGANLITPSATKPAMRIQVPAQSVAQDIISDQAPKISLSR